MLINNPKFEQRRVRFICWLAKFGFWRTTLCLAALLCVLVLGAFLVPVLPDVDLLLGLMRSLLGASWQGICLFALGGLLPAFVFTALVWRCVCAQYLLARWPVGTPIEAFMQVFGAPDEVSSDIALNGRSRRTRGFYKQLQIERVTVRKVTVVAHDDLIECVLVKTAWAVVKFPLVA